MRVFVTGATGVLGGRLVEELASRDHEVVGLVRDDAGADLVEERGGTAARGDVLEPEALERAIPDEVDVAVHAATALPTKTKPADADWARNDRVRREGARNLVEVIGDGVDLVVFPGVVWVARQPGGSTFDESAERHPDRATRSAADVEDYLREVADDRQFDATILRFGFFYAPDATHTRQFGRQLLQGDMPVIGGGLLGRRDARLSLIHADDAARALAEALEARISGLYHVVDEEPVTVADLFAEFADRLDAPDPSRIPGWLARFFVGKVTADMLTKPMPTTSDRFRDAVDWEPRFPTYREGLTQVIETWEADGTLRETANGYEWADE